MDSGRVSEIEKAMPIILTVQGLPIAQPRHRTACKGGFPRHYIPSDHAIHAWKKKVSEAAAKSSDGVIEGAIKVDCLFVFAASKKNMRGQYKISKPDIDNLCKGILDSLNTILWVDDAQVCEIHAAKMFGVESYAVIRIESIDFAVTNALETT